MNRAAAGAASPGHDAAKKTIPPSSWIALSVIVGALFGLVLTNTGSDNGEAFLFGLVYVVTCGMILGSATGLVGWQRFHGSVPSPLALGICALFRIELQGASVLSGVDFGGTTFDYILLAAVVVLCIAGIWVATLARPALVHVLERLFGFDEDRARRIEKRLAWIVILLGILGQIGQLVLG